MSNSIPCMALQETFCNYDTMLLFLGLSVMPLSLQFCTHAKFHNGINLLNYILNAIISLATRAGKIHSLYARVR